MGVRVPPSALIRNSKKLDGARMNLGKLLGQFLEIYGYSLSARWPRFKIKRQKFKRKLFRDRSLVWDAANGFWRLDEMPSNHELHSYYASEYWNHRRDQKDSINARDVSHYQDLVKHVPELFSNGSLDQKKVLNFGSGHGGLSHILWGLGFEILNVEPSKVNFEYPERWRSFTSMETLIRSLENFKFDLIYASHALEHVPDIFKTFKGFKDLSGNDTVFMFEVPDSSAPGQGGGDGRINPPHTYYYTFDFFLQRFTTTKLIASIDSKKMFELAGNTSGVILGEGLGDSIRFIGHGLR